MRKIKNGDEVMVIAGKDKGRRGVVTRTIAERNKVVVEGINIVHKCVRPNPNKGVEGGIVKQEAAIDVSNVAIYNVNTQRVTKVGFKFLKDGKKVRYYKDDGELIDV